MKKLKYILMALLIGLGTSAWAQEEDDWDDDRTEEEKAADRAAAAYWENVEEDEKKGLYAGLYVGALFSNKTSASLYDGYGFDLDGNRNDFANSWLKNRIDILRQPASGGGDQVAEAIGVDPGQLEPLEPDDMPTNMTYNIAFSFGLQGRYNFDSKNAMLFNINFSRLTVNGQFTMEVNATQVQNPTTPGQITFAEPIQTFGIRGAEQRVGLQLGYQRILGNHDFFNWVVEAGVDVCFAKFDGNWAQINDLEIDLTIRPNVFGQALMDERNLTGVGIGAFGGFGGQIDTGGSWTIQLLVNPIFQKIALSNFSQYGLHLTAGLRAIYNI